VITQARVREVFRYEAAGRLRRVQGGVKPYPAARSGNGAIVIRVDNKAYPMSALVWIYHRGLPLPYHIDHKDGDPTNNRIGNLRAASKAQNAYNSKRRADNTSGYKGAVFDKCQKGQKKWKARIHVNGRTVSLGCYGTAADAAKAYRRAAAKYAGEFARC
jgi:hypothetical protein